MWFMMICLYSYELFCVCILLLFSIYIILVFFVFCNKCSFFVVFVLCVVFILFVFFELLVEFVDVEDFWVLFDDVRLLELGVVFVVFVWMKCCKFVSSVDLKLLLDFILLM